MNKRLILAIFISSLLHVTVISVFASYHIFNTNGKKNITLPVLVNVVEPALTVDLTEGAISFETDIPSAKKEFNISKCYKPKKMPIHAKPRRKISKKSNNKDTQSSTKKTSKSASKKISTSTIANKSSKKPAKPSSHTGEKTKEDIPSPVDIKTLRFKKKVIPEYPFIARELGYEGKVLVKFVVLKDGSVSNVKIIHSSGKTVLDKAATKAVAKWRFYPIKRPVWVKTEIIFVLKE